MRASGGEFRIVVMVSGRGSNLRAIVKACDEGRISGKVVLVVSDNPEAKALEFCREHNIPAIYISPGKYKTKLVSDAEQAYINAIRKVHPDLIVLAGFMRVLKEKFLATFANRIINIHPSLLPKYPGLHTHRRVLEAGDKQSGCTVHFVNSTVDGGKRIMQARVPVFPNDTEETLAARILEREHQILPTVIQMIAERKIEYETFPDQPLIYKGS